MPLLMRCNSTSKIVGRTDIGVAIAELEKIDGPHRNSLPTLLSELREAPFTLAVSGWPATRSPQGRRVAERRDSNHSETLLILLHKSLILATHSRKPLIWPPG